MSTAAQNIPIQVEGSWEPSLTAVFLPRCAKCHAPHPLARKPAIEADTCPDCGAPVGETSTQEVPAVLGGFWGGIANVFLSIGRRLKRLSQEV